MRLIFLLPSLFMHAIAFHQMISTSLNLVKEYSIKHHIDRSHNEHHSKEVLYWAIDIMKAQRYPESHLTIIVQSCILHDLVDKKYCPDENLVKNYLGDIHTPQETDTILKIINTMSYSKTFIGNQVVFPQWIQESEYFECYHIARQADLLSSYNIARMIEYRKNLNMPDSFIKQEIPIFYYSRMANLVDSHFFIHPSAIARAEQLDAIARLKLESLEYHDFCVENLDYFRFIDYIPENDLASRVSNLSLSLH